MTSNVNNQGIAHLAFQLGGKPFCGNRRAFVAVTPDNQLGYRICSRCAARLAKMRARSGEHSACVLKNDAQARGE